jgi:hypothetical protein
MDGQTLLTLLDFSRSRLLGSLDTIERSGENVHQVLIWRPGVGRANIGWQVLHCAATHDKYLHTVLMGVSNASQPALVSCFGGGSTPSEEGIPALPVIRETLQKAYTPLRQFVQQLTPADMDRVVGPPDRQRKLGEAVILLAWHEAHHQGQIHLTWNLYKQANGIV